MVVPAYDYFEETSENVLDPWFKNIVPTVSYHIVLYIY